jgi:ABC-type glycerol-3-phosphate transport system permease component
MCAAAFRTGRAAFYANPFAGEFSLANFDFVFRQIPLARAFFNSLLVASVVTASVVTSGLLVGYVLARIEFRGRGAVTALFSTAMMIPGQLTLIPLYTLVVNLGMADSYLGLIVPFLMTPMSILLFRSAILTLPRSLFEAARMDGLSQLQTVRYLVLPLVRPTAITVALITFLGSWNEVLWPLILIHDRNLMTMPQLVTIFSVGGGSGAQLGVDMAANLVLVVPVVIAYLYLQRYFIGSLAASGTKG